VTESGAVGAAEGVCRELVLADLVEDIAFPAIRSGVDALEEGISRGGIPAGADRLKNRRFGDLAP